MPRAKAKSAGLQPEISIGMIGHVDHGKTTLTERLSGKWTDTHSEEIKRGITIRLGYADSVFVKTKDGEYSTEPKAKKEKQDYTVLRKVSFVDAPGHESLMATMLAGAAIMDGALLLVAANENCPQPQTREHLMALEIIGVENIIVVQNKMDLVTKEKALKNYKQIKDFLKGTKFENAPIIPISARQDVNVDKLIQKMEELFKPEKRDAKKDPLMFIARSFDINKPGTEIDDLKGGVLGGSLKQGKFKVGDEVEIRPGFGQTLQNKRVYKEVVTKITGAMTGGEPVKEIGPGGSVAALTTLDPAVVKSDALAGNVMGHKGKLPDVLYSFDLEIHLLDRVVGAKDDIVVEPIKKGEPLMLNVNSAATVGMVTDLKKKVISCDLKLPVCAEKGSRVTISRRLGNRFRLIGYGIIQ